MAGKSAVTATHDQSAALKATVCGGGSRRGRPRPGRLRQQLFDLLGSVSLIVMAALQRRVKSERR